MRRNELPAWIGELFDVEPEPNPDPASGQDGAGGAAGGRHRAPEAERGEKFPWFDPNHEFRSMREEVNWRDRVERTEHQVHRGWFAGCVSKAMVFVAEAFVVVFSGLFGTLVWWPFWLVAVPAVAKIVIQVIWPLPLSSLVKEAFGWLVRLPGMALERMRAHRDRDAEPGDTTAVRDTPAAEEVA